MKKTTYFFCPASDYLNQYNETGSHGQISYQFLHHLSELDNTKKIFASVITSLPVDAIRKVTISANIVKKQGQNLFDFDSLIYYINSFLRFRFTTEYLRADVVHHLLPFSFGRSFNLFFIFKSKYKKYVLGPIIGPHTSESIVSDEVYATETNHSMVAKLFVSLHKFAGAIFLSLFSRILYFLSMKTIQSADLVLFSDNHSKKFHSQYLLSSQSSEILDTGVDTSIFKPKINISVNTKTLKILFVGRLTKRKGCAYLIEALALIKNQKTAKKLFCDIVGVGPEHQYLLGQVNKYHLNNMVTFHGGVDTNDMIAHYYQNSDIVCLPALSETFTVTKEALSCGTPVIVTDICSNAERIKDGINGFVVPANSSKAIADILLTLANNPQLLAKLKRNALKEKYSYNWNSIIHRYFGMISKNVNNE